MARIAGVDLPPAKRVVISLQYIYGIGNKSAQDIVTEQPLTPGRWLPRVIRPALDGVDFAVAGGEVDVDRRPPPAQARPVHHDCVQLDFSIERKM